MVKPVKLVVSWLVLAAALAIAGYAWYRTLAAEPVGGVRWITWADTNGAPLPEAWHKEDGCDYSNDVELEALIIGEQLIVPCRTGYAFVDVARGTGTLLSVPDPIARQSTYAILPGPGDQLAVVWDGGPPEGYGGATLVAIADRARIRWRVPPTKLPSRAILATAWVDGAYEVAYYDYVKDDESDARGFQIFIARVGDGGVTQRMLAPSDGTRTAVFHGGRRGWVRVIDIGLPPTYERRVNRLLSEHGPAVDLQDGPRTPDSRKMADVDDLAVGTLRNGWQATLVLGPDGYLQDRPLPTPGPGLQPRKWKRIRVAGGALERHRAWADDRLEHWAQMIGDRPLFTRGARGARGDETLVGDDLARMRVASRLCGELVYGVWMEVAGSLALVSTDGSCYALFDPQTLEPQIRASLREHLSTDGSRTREVSTPEVERKLAVALFGLLPCLVVAAVVAFRRRWPLVPALAVGAAVYAVVALYALRDVLPLLS